MVRLDVFLPNPEATDALASCVARTQTTPAVIWLKGDLGAGKSAFSRAYLRSLGVAGAIKSPTYTLVELYDLPEGKQAAHLDLYRLAGPDDLEFLGLPERQALHLVLIEWPEQGAQALGDADLQIALAMEGDGRTARLYAKNSSAAQWLSRIAEAIAKVPLTVASA